MTVELVMNLNDRKTLEREIQRLSPFLYDIELPFCLRTARFESSHVGATRFQDLVRCVIDPLQKQICGSFSDLNVLEVACNCGGLAIELAGRGAKSVLGIDPVPHYLDQACFLKKALGHSNLEFKTAGIDDSPRLGSFDVVICCGLLYHLENPVGSMRAVAEATNDVLVLDTQVLIDETEPIWRMNVVPPIARGHPHASTGLWRTHKACQFKPSVEAVLQLLSFVGFKKVEVAPVDMNLASSARRAGAVRTFFAHKNGSRC